MARIDAAFRFPPDSPKRATNVSINGKLLAEAKNLSVNLSRAAEKRAALWLEENREAVDSSNAFVEKHGLPLARLC